MHVTPFSAATILVFAIASPLHAQGIEVFGGYSVNADYVQKIGGGFDIRLSKRIGLRAAMDYDPTFNECREDHNRIFI